MIRPGDIEEARLCQNPLRFMLRLTATEHPKYVRRRYKAYAKAAGVSPQEVIELVDAIESWQEAIFDESGDYRLPSHPDLTARANKVFAFARESDC